MTTKRIRRFSPVQVAKVMGVLYGFMGLLLAPIIFLATLAAPQQTGFNFGIGLAIGIPLFYAAIGAIMSLIAAALYNLVAGWVGGIEVEVEERVAS